MGLPTGATSGAMLSDSVPSYAHTRKASVAIPNPTELFRDPSVQMDHYNNYINIESKIGLNKQSIIPAALNTTQSDNTAHIKKIHRSDFLPTISNSRRLM